MHEALTSALDSLPHGPEFRFIDRLESLLPGKSATGTYTLPADAPFLRGHFPHQPLMPGVLMIEALAQLTGVAAQTDPVIPPLDHLRLTAVRQCKILGTIPPGATLHVVVEVTGRLGNLIQASGQVTTSGGTPLLEGQVTLSGTPQQTN